jgi:hypothetical protein
MVDAIDKKVIHDCKKILAEIIFIGARATLNCTDLEMRAKLEQAVREVKEEYDKIKI